ncbi:MAG: succinylglutamate desuccinylase/aspartoacylase family protein [Rubrivivax sp.]|nr:succinylglutamate desuccinylase/aspartoacylase family protein [Rubrivivax sp.]
MSVSTNHLRVLRFAALASGPRLIVTGAVHGNETAGTRGIERVVREVERGEIDIVRGSVTFVPVCNPLAYRHQRRIGERNLNRRLLPGDAPEQYEDHLANVLCPLLAEHDVLLDLHSFRSPGRPFALRGPADNDGALEPFAHEAAEARLAAHLGVARIVDGWLDAYSRGVAERRARGLTPGAVNEHPAYGIGTTEYMRSVGGYAVTLECGQHDDPAAPGVAYHAIRQTLALLGIGELALHEPAAPFECLTLARVIDRHAEADHFVKAWTSFDPLAAGELIALRADGSEVRAPEPGYIVFPDHAALPGHEWFYLGQRSARSLAPGKG